MATPAKHDFIARKGEDWSYAFALTDSSASAVDLTGYTVEMDVRPFPESTTTVASATVGTSQLASGIFSLSFSDTQTTDFTPGRYVYDIKLTSGSGESEFIAEGSFSVLSTVTR